MLRHAAAAEAIMERPAPPPGNHARLEQMFKEHRGVVWRMREIAEFSSFEIADLLGVPRGTVASRLRFAREAFSEAARRVELRIRREQGEA